MRNIYLSDSFKAFYSSLNDKAKTKLDYAIEVMTSIKVVNEKLVKKLTNTEFYELRVKQGNEYRIIMFSIDSDSFIESNEVILLNGFIKKSTKDYKKQIKLAKSILKDFEL
ncbi:MAG: type II toxin-antitoxin system RelE/ParE family toxin [Labilibaculum sp.]|nr:type II toxin-antitoxin system RelE/ParE family toxin [Labilibaculum sp.]